MQLLHVHRSGLPLVFAQDLLQMTQAFASDREIVGLVLHSLTQKLSRWLINAFIENQLEMGQKSGKILRPKSRWVRPYKKEHPTDKLKIKLLFNEKIRGDRIVGLKARIEAGDVHQLHIHKNEYVLVYSLSGKCLVTIGAVTKIISTDTMMFIPPKVPHRFYNKFSVPWEGIAFAIGSGSKIDNI